MPQYPVCKDLLLGETPEPREMPLSCSSTSPTPRWPRSRISRAPGLIRGPRGGLESRSPPEVSRSSFNVFPSRRPWAEERWKAVLRGGAGYSPRRCTPQLTRGRPPVVVRAQSRVWGNGSRDARRALAHDPTAALQLCTRACCAAQLPPLIPVGCFHPPPEPGSPAVAPITEPHPSTAVGL